MDTILALILFVADTALVANSEQKLCQLVEEFGQSLRQLTNSTVVIHLLKLMPYIFLPLIMPNLFSNLLKNSFFNRKCQSFQF